MRASEGLVLALLLLAGCGEEAGDDRCAQTLAALRGRLEAAAALAEPDGAPDWVSLPSGDGVPYTARGPLLVVSSDEVELDGLGVGGADEDAAAEALAGDLRRWGAGHRLSEDAELPVGVWASADTTLERLSRLLRAAPPRARFRLLVRGADDGETPEWLVEAFAPADRGLPRVRQQRLRSARIHRAWVRATDSCEAARAHPVGVAHPEGARTSALPGLLEALEGCGCEDADLTTVEAAATRALIPTDGPVLRLPPLLRFGPATDDAPELRFEPTDTVETLRDRAATESGTVWVRVD